MQLQLPRKDGAEAAGTRLRLTAGARIERKEDPLRPTAWRERDVDLVVEVAHDLRSPLTSIIALAELLQTGQSGPVNETQRRQLGLMYSAALCLCATASDLIELAHDGDRLAETTPVRLSIKEMFGNVGDMVRPMAEVRGLQLKFASPESDARMGCPRAIGRVLLNLATNAVKNTDYGSVTIVARAMGERRVEFSVRDTGRGIATEEITHLFEPFPSNHTQDKNHFSSAGLGLAISRKLIVAMGSELKVESAPEWGTRFSFEMELPVA